MAISPVHAIPASCWSPDDARFGRLIAFATDVLAVCAAADDPLDPVLDGGLALQVHLGGAPFPVHDVDFGCPEADFARLAAGLQAAGIFCEVQPWHVLQARRDGLKVEFGAAEVWNRGLDGPYERVRIGGYVVRMMDLGGLREQYRRGAVATADDPDDPQPEKHARIVAKLAALDAAIASRGEAADAAPRCVRR
ncbi:MAG: hypothetical protein ACTHQE_17115 [Thermomicrobiales bacterium]